MSVTMTPMNKIIKTLSDKTSILIATHVYPDGDALGSQLALGNILENLGKEVFLYAEERVSHIYDFMPGCERLNTHLPDLGALDCAIALDCGDRYRLGREMDFLLKMHPFMVIDHHAGHKNFGDLRWVEPHRSSTAEMVYDLAVALAAEVSYDAAYCLYSAIVSDSGSFKYESTSAHTFEVAGELIAKGVRASEVADKLFDNYTVNRLHLLESVLATLELYADNRIALITATREMFASTGATKEDTEDFINFPRALSSVNVVAFFKEVEDNRLSVSLRSKGNGDVSQVANKFGGGGHRNAAGFRLNNSAMIKVREELLQELVKIVD